jgi:hypothetical protein
MRKLTHAVAEDLSNIHSLNVFAVLSLGIMAIRHVEILNHYRLIVLAILSTLSHVYNAWFG